MTLKKADLDKIDTTLLSYEISEKYEFADEQPEHLYQMLAEIKKAIAELKRYRAKSERFAAKHKEIRG